MRRRPTPKVLKAGRPAKPGLPEGTTARDAMWSALRAAGRLTLTEAMAVAFCDRSSARVYLTSLVAAGLARQENDGAQTFSLISDPGPTTPRVRRDGSAIEAGGGRAAAWKAMRVLGTFTVRDLHAAAGIAISDAKHYCKYLASAGYLIVVREGKGGGPGTERPSTFRFVPSRYKGPLAPQVLRIRSVWDPNVAAIVWPQGDEDLAENLSGDSPEGAA